MIWATVLDTPIAISMRSNARSMAAVPITARIGYDPLSFGITAGVASPTGEVTL
jgi:hypothetical protein